MYGGSSAVLRFDAKAKESQMRQVVDVCEVGKKRKKKKLKKKRAAWKEEGDE